jgi:DNA-binding transcriptional MocR family regulator
MDSPKKIFLYSQLADTREELIRQQVWRAGEKVPSVRRLSQQHQVSLSTAFQAYYHLENKGLLEARPKSGYFVRLAADHRPAPAQTEPKFQETEVCINDRLATVLEARRGHAVPFAMAVPSLDLLPVARLNKAVVSAMRTATNRGIGYELTAGNEELRRQVARQSLRWGGHLAPEDLTITSGCLEALNLCLRAVTKPGDTVAIESPTYYGILQTIENMVLKALELPTHPQTGVSLEHLEAALQRKKVAACLFVSNFNNPLGSCIPDAHKQELVLLLKRWNVPLIEDDIYGELHFGPTRPKTCKAFDHEGLVLLCSSFSKQLAPGYRVGWVAAGRYHRQVQQLKLMHNLATATLPQLAISHFLEHGRYEHHLRQLRTAFAAQVQHTARAINQYFPEGTRVTQPAGGFVLWLELPQSVDAFALYQQANAQGIGFVPGHLFSAQGKYHNCLRLSCGHPWNEHLERGVETIGNLVKAQL